LDLSLDRILNDDEESIRQNVIPQSKFIFHSKLNASAFHQGQINSEVFKTLFLGGGGRKSLSRS